MAIKKFIKLLGQGFLESCELLETKDCLDLKPFRVRVWDFKRQS